MGSPDATEGVNDDTDKIQEVVANCKTYWSKAQQFSIIRMSESRANNEYDLLDWYEIRAKRIAATYARFYLETEEGGDLSKIGRYYWMALGAFASKTVACVLDDWRVKSNDAVVGLIPRDPFDAKIIADGLGKGNLWLFMDISAPHYFYNNFPQNFFEGMVCIDKRDAKDLEAPIQSVVDSMPWADSSLPVINNMALSSDLKRAFRLTSEVEVMSDGRQRKDKQMAHLMAVAQHEQNEVLQPLIYEDERFSDWSKFQREGWFGIAKFFSPALELVFSHSCSIRDGRLKSEAPDDMKVEDFDSRMKWITTAANKFHGLMSTERAYMMGELRTIATWYNLSDYAGRTRAIAD
ncbi:DUF2515 family protein [Ningiella sp. W23]|uniref:DUF2515 family protein n=1 Tax=Ningiella sp. W23 TaxID=3023715 RepID=UPI0037568479